MNSLLCDVKNSPLGGIASGPSSRVPVHTYLNESVFASPYSQMKNPTFATELPPDPIVLPEHFRRALGELEHGEWCFGRQAECAAESPLAAAAVAKGCAGVFETVEREDVAEGATGAAAGESEHCDGR